MISETYKHDEKTIDNTTTNALFELSKKAFELYTLEKYDEVFILANNGHELGDDSMTYLLGSLYFFGLGVEKNMCKAYEYFLKNALTNSDKSTNIHAKYLVTLMSLGYEGISVNLELESKLIQKPLRQNYLDSVNVNNLINQFKKYKIDQLEHIPIDYNIINQSENIPIDNNIINQLENIPID